jgi:hypothetical protein
VSAASRLVSTLFPARDTLSKATVDMSIGAVRKRATNCFVSGCMSAAANSSRRLITFTKSSFAECEVVCKAPSES